MREVLAFFGDTCVMCRFTNPGEKQVPKSFTNAASPRPGAPSREAESVGILRVESHFNSLDLMAQFNSRSQLQLHALLHRRKSQQQERLAVDVLFLKYLGQGGTIRELNEPHNVRDRPL